MHTFFLYQLCTFYFPQELFFYWALMVFYMLLNSAFVSETQQLKWSRLSI